MFNSFSMRASAFIIAALFAGADAAAQEAVDFKRIGNSGFTVFDGIYSVADNPALVMEETGRDIGRDVASLWMIYRWKNTSKSAASCELHLDRLDYLGFYGEKPDQAVEDRKAAEFYANLAESTIGTSHTRLETFPKAWGRLTLHETISENDTVGEQLGYSAVYVSGAYTYEIDLLCRNAPEAELRDLAGAIETRNITQQ
jgi:geranylgeranyl pyrophosphate synthase